jgi:hypothetical protein
MPDEECLGPTGYAQQILTLNLNRVDDIGSLEFHLWTKMNDG